MALIGRFLRFVILLLGIGIGVVGTLFAVGNQESIAVTIWAYTFHVQVYALALGPLAVGLAVGWLYTVPARTQEFADHWRSWRTLRRMEKENKQLRRSLDRVLELPEDAAPALKGHDLPKERAQLEVADHALEAEPVVVHEVKASPPVNGGGRAVKRVSLAPADLPAELADLEPIAEVKPRPEHAARPAAAKAARADGDGGKSTRRRSRHEPKPAAHAP